LALSRRQPALLDGAARFEPWAKGRTNPRSLLHSDERTTDALRTVRRLFVGARWRAHAAAHRGHAHVSTSPASRQWLFVEPDRESPARRCHTPHVDLSAQ